MMIAALPDRRPLPAAFAVPIRVRRATLAGKPALGVPALILFIASWNDFIGPLIFLCNPDTQYAAARNAHRVRRSIGIAELPLSVLFGDSMRQVVTGLTAGAVD